MITPVFEISQDDNNLVFKIRAPYAKLSELEVEFTDQLFLFSCTPYYLRVHLPRKIQDDQGNNSSYDADSGVFTIVVPKQNEGEVFEDLDMVSELLRPQKLPSAQKPVEEIFGENNSDDEINEEEYYQEQKPKDMAAGIKDEEANLYGYGFGWRRTGVLEQLRDQIGPFIDLQDPEVVDLKERVRTCAEFDANNFDGERYLCDTLQTEDSLRAIIEAEFEGNLELTEENRIKLKDMPNKKIAVLTAEEEQASLYTLVDLVYSWVYDQRVNGWESNCESGWTISHLSPSLSFLIKYDTLEQACIGAIRRSLCYPLYRNWSLAAKTLQDTLLIFQKGKSALVHVMCEIHSTMIASAEFRYLHNDLLVTDLLLWLQALSAAKINNLTRDLSNILVTKDDIGLDLEELELNGRVLLMAVDNGDLDSDDEQ